MDSRVESRRRELYVDKTPSEGNILSGNLREEEAKRGAEISRQHKHNPECTHSLIHNRAAAASLSLAAAAAARL
jgi:hypothetical protein